MKAKGLMCLVAAVTLLASAGVVCAYDETGTTTTLGEGTATTLGNFSTIVGYNAGNGDSSTGLYNTFIGAYAGTTHTNGNGNTFIGYYVGRYNTSGDANTSIGEHAGYYNSIGYYNTSIGSYAGYSNTTGHSNTSIGPYAGYSNSVGEQNVFLGYRAGYSEKGSNKLYIDNCFSGSLCTNPFIYGEFDNRLLKVDGSVGIGVTPIRQLHVAGSNAVFRMDRSADTASFMLVRTDVSSNPLKTFVVGTNASGANQGEFVINDLGTAVAGPGTRRMTITNNGAVDFTGIVTAPQVIETSSLAFKTNVRTYENALETVKRLRGVHFDWKESGKAAVGLIAEEVEGVVPEVVAHEGNGGAATGLNYSGLVGVLVEAVKEQQAAITKQESVMSEYREALTKQQEINAELKAEINRLKSRDMIAQR